MEKEKRANKSSKMLHDNKHIMKSIDSSKRPVIGVLSEPLRGKIHAKGSDDEVVDVNSYIPKAHVKFLEQAGITVVPVSYQSTPEELAEMMNKLSGLYIPGDSQRTLTDIEYKKSFYSILQYVEEQNTKQKDHFPIFLMGNSFNNLVSMKEQHGHNVREMSDL